MRGKSTIKTTPVINAPGWAFGTPAPSDQARASHVSFETYGRVFAPKASEVSIADHCSGHVGTWYPWAAVRQQRSTIPAMFP